MHSALTNLGIVLYIVLTGQGSAGIVTKAMYHGTAVAIKSTRLCQTKAEGDSKMLQKTKKW